MILSASPVKIPSRMGVATITATGVKSTGAPIWDDTQLVVSADVGRVDPQIVYFRDGRAEARYYAPEKIGTANISATCGRIQITPITIDVGGGAYLLSYFQPTELGFRKAEARSLCGLSHRMSSAIL